MKQFFRSFTGKSILFVMCTLSILLTLASVVTAAWMIGGRFYTQTKEEIFEKIAYRDVLMTAAKIVDENAVFIEDRIQKFKTASDARPSDIQPSDARLKEDRNLVFEILLNDRVIIRSETAGPSTKWESRFEMVHAQVGYTDFEYGLKYSSRTYTLHPLKEGEKAELCIRIAFIEGFPHTNSLSLLYSTLGIAYSLKYWIYPIGIFFGIPALTCFLSLLAVSARKTDSEKLHPGALNKIPFDLLCLMEYLGLLVAIHFVEKHLSHVDYLMKLFALALVVLIICIFVGMSMSAAARIKQGTFVKNNLLYILPTALVHIYIKAGRHLLRLLYSLRPTPRLTLLILPLLFVEFIFLQASYHNGSQFFMLWILKKILFVLLVFYVASSMHRLRKAGSALAGGNLGYQVDTKGLHFDFKEHAQDLNSIAKGMAIAIEDRMRSERMKTELITNVSHDIKTPLTSIVNYSQLLNEASAIDNPDISKINEYSDILIKHSDKLKRLIEDLVEASKASSGNLELSLAPADASLYLSQICGEYADRMEASGLTPVVSAPPRENPSFILADGRRMWRIFDNVMNNICKYSLYGTRVYLSLENIKRKDGEYAVFTFKNTSKDPLNLSADELFERFIRGDKSRNTEGNGLGLSIAKSLVELQGGNMEIEIDGDLFKVRMMFPVAN